MRIHRMGMLSSLAVLPQGFWHENQRPHSHRRNRRTGHFWALAFADSQGVGLETQSFAMTFRCKSCGMEFCDIAEASQLSCPKAEDGQHVLEEVTVSSCVSEVFLG